MASVDDDATIDFALFPSLSPSLLLFPLFEYVEKSKERKKERTCVLANFFSTLAFVLHHVRDSTNGCMRSNESKLYVYGTKI